MDVHALGGISFTRILRETTFSGFNPTTQEVYHSDTKDVESVPGLLLGADAPFRIHRHLALVPRARVFVTTRQVIGVWPSPRGRSVQLFIGVGLRWLS
jgi:hypothetical protein